MATTNIEPGQNVSMKHTLSSACVVASFHISTNYIIIGLDNGSINIFSRSESQIVKALQHDCATWALDVWGDTDICFWRVAEEAN
jgi:hypothetical protein